MSPTLPVRRGANQRTWLKVEGPAQRGVTATGKSNNARSCVRRGERGGGTRRDVKLNRKQEVQRHTRIPTRSRTPTGSEWEWSSSSPCALAGTAEGNLHSQTSSIRNRKVLWSVPTARIFFGSSPSSSLRPRGVRLLASRAARNCPNNCHAVCTVSTHTLRTLVEFSVVPAASNNTVLFFDFFCLPPS